MAIPSFIKSISFSRVGILCSNQIVYTCYWPKQSSPIKGQSDGDVFSGIHMSGLSSILIEITFLCLNSHWTVTSTSNGRLNHIFCRNEIYRRSCLYRGRCYVDHEGVTHEYMNYISRWVLYFALLGDQWCNPLLIKGIKRFHFYFHGDLNSWSESYVVGSLITKLTLFYQKNYFTSCWGIFNSKNSSIL